MTLKANNMKNLLLFTIISLLFVLPANAQNAIAKIKYEQAEEAFIKNDYHTVLIKLDEAQKLLGASNPKILYLRLMAGKGIIASGKYDYGFLVAARKDADEYLKKYNEVQGIEEKFREVYDFSESLNKLPATRELFEQKEAAAAQQLAEWIKTRPLQVSDSLMNAYRVKRCATVKEFMAYNPGAFIGLRKVKSPPEGITLLYNNGFNYSSPGPSDIYFDAKGLRVYVYTVQADTDPATAKKVYQSLVNLYPAGMDTTAAVKQELTTKNGAESAYLVLMPPATGNKGSISIMYFSMYGKAHVQLTFNPQ